MARNWIRTLAPIRVTPGTEYRFVIVTDLTPEQVGEIFPEPPIGAGGD